MPIARDVAEGNVATLQGLSAAALFGSIKGYFKKKHENRIKAEAWAKADNQPKGYFEKETSIAVRSLAEYKQLGKKYINKLDTTGKVTPKTFGKGKELHYERTVDLDDNDFVDLIGKIINDPNAIYCESRLPPNPDPEQLQNAANRFTLIADIPQGYVGRCITYANGEYAKAKGLTKAVLVINAGAQPTPFNVFPCTQAQALGYTPLP